MRRRAFTLVEMLISVGMVVLLMMGVSYIFRTTSQTAGSAQVASTLLRDQRAAQAIIAHDLKGFAADGPVMVIGSTAVAAFMHRPDELANAVGADSANPLKRDLNGAGH